MRLTSACLLATLTLGACSRVPVMACREGASAMAQDQLYFGLSRPGGGEVSAAQWQTFLRDEVTPRFPQGLSVVAAAGQWRGSDGRIVQEDSRVLILVHAGDAASESAVQAIVAAYKQQFAQESVLRLSQRACASF